jgi:hypothetical protein
MVVLCENLKHFLNELSQSLKLPFSFKIDGTNNKLTLHFKTIKMILQNHMDSGFLYFSYDVFHGMAYNPFSCRETKHGSLEPNNK